MNRPILILLFLLFSFTTYSQVDFGLGLGGTLSFPRIQQPAGQLTLDLDTYCQTDWKERWMIAAYARYDFSKVIRAELSVEHRSHAYLLGRTTIGKRGVYTPLKLEIGFERKIYVSLGVAPSIYYREYVRRDGNYSSRRVEDPEIQLAFIGGLVYDINDRFSLLAHYSWNDQVFERDEIYDFGGQKIADVEVQMNHISFAVRMRSSTHREGGNSNLSSIDSTLQIRNAMAHHVMNQEMCSANLPPKK